MKKLEGSSFLLLNDKWLFYGNHDIENKETIF